MLETQGRKKKILFVITKSNWGGAQRYVFDLATKLPQNQFDVAVAYGGSGELVDRLSRSGIRTIPITCLARDINILKEVTVLKTLIRLFKKESPDIVHLNSSKIGGIGSLAARIVKVKRIVFTAHGWAFKERRNIFYIIFVCIASWFTLFLSHVVISVSYSDMQSALEFPFVKKKSRMIHNGIVSPEYLSRESARNAIAQAAGVTISSDIVLIGTTAELHKNKGIEYMLKALCELKKKRHKFLYTVIGEGEERTRLEALINEKDLVNEVQLLGYISQAPQFMKAFDIFVLPSLKEGLPYVLLEAGMAGIPIVASNVGGIQEIINHGISGLLIPSGDSRALRESIDELFHNEDERRTYGIRIKREIESRFEILRMLRETISVYLE